MINIDPRVRESDVEADIEQSRTAVSANGNTAIPEDPSRGFSPEEPTLRIEALLLRVSGELDRLTGLVGTVEQALPTILASRSESLDTATLSALQEIDLIAQMIAALSGFVRAVTPLRKDDLILIGSGLRAVPLAEMVARLGAAERAETLNTCANKDQSRKPNEYREVRLELFGNPP